MDKYEEVLKMIENMSDEEVVQVLVKTFGVTWFRNELEEWVDNCDDTEINELEEVINQVRKANNG